MKLRLNILLLVAALMVGAGFTSCSDDDFTASIFDTTERPLDRTQYSFPLDTFIKKNFLEPYNLQFLYRMEDIGSDMQKNLVPASYDKSVDLAVLSKYLWYDVYKQLSAEGVTVDNQFSSNPTFLQSYSPRIIHVIGSASYNTSTGTETLGTAEGGKKITLYKVNRLDPNDIDFINEYFFKTMHHEFGHILDQTIQRPTEFNTISNGLYDATDWGNKPDSCAVALGFVSNYASSQAREDWVEVMANYIVKDSITWAHMLNTASYDWEDRDDIDEDWYNSLIKPGCNYDSIGYSHRTSGGDFKVFRRVIDRDANGYALNGQITYPNGGNADGVDGRAVILQKLELVRNWLARSFHIDLDKLRAEVQKRQYLTNPDGTFQKDANGRFINRLISPSESDPSVSLIDSLRQQVYQYKALQVTQ